LDPDTHRVLASVQCEAQRRWAVENAGGLGRHLAQWLIARAEQVADVPSTATEFVSCHGAGAVGMM
jgi:transposase